MSISGESQVNTDDFNNRNSVKTLHHTDSNNIRLVQLSLLTLLTLSTAVRYLYAAKPLTPHGKHYQRWSTLMQHLFCTVVSYWATSKLWWSCSSVSCCSGGFVPSQQYLVWRICLWMHFPDFCCDIFDSVFAFTTRNSHLKWIFYTKTTKCPRFKLLYLVSLT